MKKATSKVVDASRAKRRDVHGEHSLSGIEFVKVALESNKTETFNTAAEVAVPDPDDFEAIAREVQRAPARLVFWDYQAARLEARMRTEEIALAKLEGEKYSMIRDVLKEEGDGSYVADWNVRAAVDYDENVILKRAHVLDLRFNYKVLKCVRDAVEHRTYILRKLLDRLPVATLR